MFSLTCYLVCTGLMLVQVVAALPWLIVFFFRREQTTLLSTSRERQPLLQSSLARKYGITILVFALIVFLSPFLVAFQERQGMEAMGFIYAALLQLQLTVDFLIIAIAVMLRVWPKGGAVAQATFREGVRQPLFWIIVLFALLSMSLTPLFPYFTFGEDYVMTKEIGYDIIMLATAVFGVLAATLFVTDEIEGRTAITLMSKPVSRRQFLLGKFAGILLASILLFGVLGFCFQDMLLFKHWFETMDPVSPPRWLSDSLAYLALPSDATDILKGLGMWTQHMLDTLPGLVLTFCQVMVLVAFAVAFATRVPMVVNLTGILTIFCLAHLCPTLVAKAAEAQANPDDTLASQMFSSTIVKFVAQVFDTLLPALKFFQVSPRLVGDSPPEAGPYAIYLGSVLFYGCIYTCIVLLIGLILFEDRDLA